MKKILIVATMLAFTTGSAFAGNNGKRCTFDTECFPGYCVKSMGSISGICAGGYGKSNTMALFMEKGAQSIEKVNLYGEE